MMKITQSIFHACFPFCKQIKHTYSSMSFHQYTWKRTHSVSVTSHTFSTQPHTSPSYTKLWASFIAGSITCAIAYGPQKQHDSFCPIFASCKGDNIPLIPQNTPLTKASSQQHPIDWNIVFHEAKTLQNGIQNNTIDIQHTHIPFLVSILERNFSCLFSEEFLITAEPEQRQEIQDARKEMQNRIRENTVSYAYWLFFHARLALIATPPKHRSITMTPSHTFPLCGLNLAEKPWSSWPQETISSECHNLKKHCNNGLLLPFPIATNALSIVDMNRTVGSSIFLINLIHRPMVRENEIMFPLKLFYHDVRRYRGISPHTQEKLLQMRKRLEQLKDAVLWRQDKLEHSIINSHQFDQARLHNHRHEINNVFSYFIRLLDYCFFHMTNEQDLCQQLIKEHSSWDVSWFSSLFATSPTYALIKKTLFIDELHDMHLNPELFGLQSYEALFTCSYAFLYQFLHQKEAVSPTEFKQTLYKLYTVYQQHTPSSFSIDKMLKRAYFYNKVPLSNGEYAYYDKFRVKFNNELLSNIVKMSKTSNIKTINATQQTLHHIQQHDPELFHYMTHKYSQLTDIIQYYEMRHERLLNTKIERFMDHIDATYV